jgi:hypothetical protein
MPGTRSSEAVMTMLLNTGAHAAAKYRRRACSSAFATADIP